MESWRAPNLTIKDHGILDDIAALPWSPECDWTSMQAMEEAMAPKPKTLAIKLPKGFRHKRRPLLPEGLQ